MVKRYLLPMLLLAVACGDGGGSSAPATLTILTQSVQPGNVGFAYFQPVQTVGGAGPFTWWMSSTGDPLPDGLVLSNGGCIVGTPEYDGVYQLTIAVQDAAGSTRTLDAVLEVRDVELTPNGLPAMNPGEVVDFSAAGGGSGYVFSLPVNESGATLTPDGEYKAGNADGVDVVRVTDQDGFIEEAALTVGQDPFAGFRADWGGNDIWYIDWDVVYDPIPTQPTDFDETLHDLGLRGNNPQDPLEAEAYGLARKFLIRRTLAHLSRFYGNGPDGNPMSGGLAISFVGPAGVTGGQTPGVGGILPASGNRYNTICVRHGPQTGIVGTAWLNPDNTAVEHNCGNPGSTVLGVFSNRMVGPYLTRFGNSLYTAPVTSADTVALNAMLLGQAPPHARAQAIYDLADQFGQLLAAVLAHEVGHSLGLNHSSPPGGAGDLMNASIGVGRGIQYRFNGDHWAKLSQALPGPGR
ncbi:MAG: putative Ig domain-containing protein [Planctomycetota bacterium]|nr:putative Ig domain-containing protein [Planctomycetota bacterium]